MEAEMKNKPRVSLDEMLLVKGTPILAGSRMLADCIALFDSAVAERLRAAGYSLGERIPVGEFAVDLPKEGAASPLECPETLALVSLDVNGNARRACARDGGVCIKPTYGSISRYGAVSVAPSGETVSVTARCASDCREVLSSLVSYDDRDGTSLPEELCARVRETGIVPRRVCIVKEFLQGTAEDVRAQADAVAASLRASGVEVIHIEDAVLPVAHAAWNTVLCAEICKSTARYDGIRYGYRSEKSKTLDSLYTHSRGEAFGALLKSAILYGSEVLSPKNYEALYCKSLRVRTKVRERFDALFSEYDAVLLPAVSALRQGAEYDVFSENFYTAPSSLTGLPCAVVGGVQLIGAPFSEGMLLRLAELAEGGSK